MKRGPEPGPERVKMTIRVLPETREEIIDAGHRERKSQGAVVDKKFKPKNR